MQPLRGRMWTHPCLRKQSGYLRLTDPLLAICDWPEAFTISVLGFRAVRRHAALKAAWIAHRGRADRENKIAYQTSFLCCRRTTCLAADSVYHDGAGAAGRDGTP